MVLRSCSNSKRRKRISRPNPAEASTGERGRVTHRTPTVHGVELAVYASAFARRTAATVWQPRQSRVDGCSRRGRSPRLRSCVGFSAYPGVQFQRRDSKRCACAASTRCVCMPACTAGAARPRSAALPKSFCVNAITITCQSSIGRRFALACGWLVTLQLLKQE